MPWYKFDGANYKPKRYERAPSKYATVSDAWTERVCEPNRIYDAVTGDAGFNHNYHAPQAPAIIYDTLKGRYVQANSVTQLSKPIKPHVVQQDARRVMKSYVSNTDW